MMIENAVHSSGTEGFGFREHLSPLRAAAAERTVEAPRSIVGQSAALKDVLQLVDLVAGSTASVLITGETGTGKELVARAIHDRSLRRQRPFVAVNCGAVPAALIASELFGHEKGAFTGALQRRVGRFELASGGTLFLDEIGELPMETQTALLRVLQEKEFERVGGTQTVRVDVRIVAATNRDLEEEVAAGRFRADLYYRLNVVPVAMPPLRDRREDIPLLAQHFVERCARTSGKAVRRLSDDSLRLLRLYTWPGNVRELQNIVERAVILARGEAAIVEERWLHGRNPVTDAHTAGASSADHAGPVSPSESAFAARVSARDRQIIETALAETRGRVSGPYGAAARLQLPASTLESKIRTLGIDKNRFKRSWSPES
ncbi:MAG TPA: sigma-54 dependent transcriptional regulator [Candidatus Polarisedimenticolia bacterium]|nr:sigma-54 dependent transcriptional regulator [Candidatus Polarisedimenticolia bacterium]